MVHRCNAGGKAAIASDEGKRAKLANIMSYHVVRPVPGYEAFTTPFMAEGTVLQVCDWSRCVQLLLLCGASVWCVNNVFSRVLEGLQGEGAAPQCSAWYGPCAGSPTMGTSVMLLLGS